MAIPKKRSFRARMRFRTIKMSRRLFASGSRKDRARVALVKNIPRRAVCAEIGVWQGDFSEFVLRAAKPARLHLIDPWRFESGSPYRSSQYGGKAAKDQGDMDRRYKAVLRRFRRPIDRGIVTVHRCDSSTAAIAFDDEYFDWIYIDGNHFYEFVKLDLLSYWPKLKRGGCLAGDDYGIQGWWRNGVQEAVDEFVDSHHLEVQLLQRGQFLIPKP